MGSNLYGEIRDDLKWIVDALEDAELNYKAYNRGAQYNVTTEGGGTHSYYPTTGTVLLHSRRSKKTANIKGCTVFEFIDIVSNQDRINQLLNQ
ncbi:MAG: hypothetical protein ACK5MN_03300 [Lachnospiraceae bacterium]